MGSGKSDYSHILTERMCRDHTRGSYRALGPIQRSDVEIVSGVL
jgi:hypothetical protein